MAIRKKYSYNVPGSAKSRIYAGKSTKRGFSKKALKRIEIFFLFYVPMNTSKAWKAKLEAGIFLAIYKPVQAVCIDNNGSSVIMILT